MDPMRDGSGGGSQAAEVTLFGRFFSVDFRVKLGENLKLVDLVHLVYRDVFFFFFRGGFKRPLLMGKCLKKSMKSMNILVPDEF